MYHPNGGKPDVTVGVPIATIGHSANEPPPPSPEELCKFYWREICELRVDMKRREEMLQVTSSVALGMLKLLVDMGYATEQNEITVPLAVHHFLDGASIQVSRNDAGDITVRLIEV